MNGNPNPMVSVVFRLPIWKLEEPGNPHSALVLRATYVKAYWIHPGMLVPQTAVNGRPCSLLAVQVGGQECRVIATSLHPDNSFHADLDGTVVDDSQWKDFEAKLQAENWQTVASAPPAQS